MDNCNLPNVEPEPEPVKEEVAPPPQIEVVVNQAEDIVPQEQIFKDAEPAPPPKKKRTPSKAQLENLARMREKRAENRAKAKAEKEAKAPPKIPANATPVPKGNQILSEPEMPKLAPKDGFYDFMSYMEKYKNIKANWRKREMEKAKEYMSRKQKAEEPKPPPKKPQTQTKPKAKTPTPSLLTNHNQNSNPYSDYF